MLAHQLDIFRQRFPRRVKDRAVRIRITTVIKQNDKRKKKDKYHDVGKNAYFSISVALPSLSGIGN